MTPKSYSWTVDNTNKDIHWRYVPDAYLPAHLVQQLDLTNKVYDLAITWVTSLPGPVANTAGGEDGFLVVALGANQSRIRNIEGLNISVSFTDDLVGTYNAPLTIAVGNGFEQSKVQAYAIPLTFPELDEVIRVVINELDDEFGSDGLIVVRDLVTNAPIALNGPNYVKYEDARLFATLPTEPTTGMYYAADIGFPMRLFYEKPLNPNEFSQEPLALSPITEPPSDADVFYYPNWTNTGASEPLAQLAAGPNPGLYYYSFAVHFLYNRGEATLAKGETSGLEGKANVTIPSGNYSSVKYAEFSISDADTNAVYGTGYTDKYGWAYFTVPSLFSSIRVEMKLLSKSKNGDKLTLHRSNNSDFAYFQGTALSPKATNAKCIGNRGQVVGCTESTWVLDQGTTRINGGPAYTETLEYGFRIWGSLIAGIEHVRNVYAEEKTRFSGLEAYFPSSRDSAGYDPTGNDIYYVLVEVPNSPSRIGRTRRRTVFHEFSHWVMDMLQKVARRGHSSCRPDEGLNSERGAWQEGFAEFFGRYLNQFSNELENNRSLVGISSCSNDDEASNFMPENEWAVMALLNDVVDGKRPIGGADPEQKFTHPYSNHSLEKFDDSMSTSVVHILRKMLRYEPFSVDTFLEKWNDELIVADSKALINIAKGNYLDNGMPESTRKTYYNTTRFGGGNGNGIRPLYVLPIDFILSDFNHPNYTYGCSVIKHPNSVNNSFTIGNVLNILIYLFGFMIIFFRLRTSSESP